MQVTTQGGFAAFQSLDGRSVYYAKGRNVSGLWRVSVDGGEEAPVLEFPKVRYWILGAVGGGHLFRQHDREAARARILRLCHASYQACRQARTRGAAK